MYRLQAPGGGQPPTEQPWMGAQHPTQQPWAGAQPPPQQPWMGAQPSYHAPQHAPTGPRAMRQFYGQYPSQNNPLGAYPSHESYVPSPWGDPQLGRGYWSPNNGYPGFPQPTGPSYPSYPLPADLRYPPYPPPGLNQVHFHAEYHSHAQFSADRASFQPSGTSTAAASSGTAYRPQSGMHYPSQGYVKTDRQRNPRQQQTAHSEGAISRPMKQMRNLPDHLSAWQLTKDQLEPGLVVQTKENKKGWSGHPAIVLGWDKRGVVKIIQLTGFGETNPHINDRFGGIDNPYVVRRLSSAYLLIADQDNSPTHFNLPILRLEDGMFMPKRSYVNCVVVLRLHINKLMHFSPNHQFERRCLTKESIRILREHRKSFSRAIEWQRQQIELRKQKGESYRLVDY
ncbi:uncharacterized protein LTHEOB_9326 [Lasiodiplodia theobromae]|uniref:uncharacterized protein n=1 Tax=Lasiodiplodia theobromae TaxID=45133 RepID=UPI0015C3BA5C|nr:uncharacterized protein LTHEOB_9326 [Lasiodiplodia theobromae]KAF4540230.1 hypothetical protein LTHEOB_9326 [Lasiodiplodia theobromae]